MSFRPEPNKAIERERESVAYEAHRRKVERAQAIVDTRPPRTYVHQHLNMKRLQMEEERLANIERDNRKLLQRMSNIMRTGGRIDNWNNSEYRSNSGRDRRQLESWRVARENQFIHDRISSRKPEYDHNQWEKEWAVNQRRIEQHSAFNKDGTEKYPRRPRRSEDEEKKSKQKDDKKKKERKQRDSYSSDFSDDSSGEAHKNKDKESNAGDVHRDT